MPVEITDKMFNQLERYLDHYQNDWCIIKLELIDGKFLFFQGELYSNEDNILFKSIDEFELILFFNYLNSAKEK